MLVFLARTLFLRFILALLHVMLHVDPLDISPQVCPEDGILAHLASNQHLFLLDLLDGPTPGLF